MLRGGFKFINSEHAWYAPIRIRDISCATDNFRLLLKSPRARHTNNLIRFCEAHLHAKLLLLAMFNRSHARFTIRQKPLIDFSSCLRFRQMWRQNLKETNRESPLYLSQVMRHRVLSYLNSSPSEIDRLLDRWSGWVAQKKERQYLTWFTKIIFTYFLVIDERLKPKKSPDDAFHF